VGGTNRQSYPFPVTARTCKHYHGFRWDDEEAHGLQDILLRQWVIEELYEQTGRLHKDYPLHCGECGAKLEAVGSGVYEPQEDGTYRQPRVWLQRFSRVAMDRRRGVAADQLLHTLEVIAEEMDTGRRRSDWSKVYGITRLAGRVWTAAGTDLLYRQLEAIFCLGGDTARGLGVVHISVDRSDPVAETVPPERVEALAAAVRGEIPWDQMARQETDLAARLARFNGAMRRMYDDYGLSWPASVLFFSVDLLSDTIWPQGGTAAGLLPTQLAGAEGVRAFAGAHVHSGWHTAARMMRRTELAIDAGSVFLYRLPGANDPIRLQVTLDTLLALERDGAGRERERGYGWVQICTPFHLEVKPK